MKLIGLDVGSKRIGVAKADTVVRIATPEGFVVVNGQEFSEIARIARLHNTNIFVVGLPRSSKGEETAQSAYVRKFAHTLAQTIPGSRIYFQDESLTSVEAERRLRASGKPYSRGDIDAEAAAIILQDCIEHFKNRITPSETSSSADIGDIWAEAGQEPASAPKKKSILKILLCILLTLVIFIGGGIFFANHWYNSQLTAIAPGLNCETGTELIPDGCRPTMFAVEENETIKEVSKNLKNQGLIRSDLAFRLYARFTNQTDSLKAGKYSFNESMTTPDILAKIVAGDVADNVFNFTIIPGETISSIKQKLIAEGYRSDEIDAAFSRDYSNINDHLKMLLSTKPESASLEGYLFGETYQFYKNEAVENIIIRTMEQLYTVAASNNLFSAYEEMGLSFHEGLTLASIVQKEANSPDQPGVARVFFNRLHQGIVLGSDVTAAYAVDLIDPDRLVYTDNSLILELDSPYNTRKTAGLPPTPIASPGVSALLAVANPTPSDYLYFLTGDDGVVYYGYTEDEHNKNREEHCQELCNIGL